MVYAFCVAIIVSLIVASVVADIKFPHSAQLPMQWGINGKPTWFAPRAIALAFTPVLAMCVIGFVTVLSQRASSVLVVVAVAFLAAHLLHLWLVHRHLTRT